MNDTKLDTLHDREVDEHRRSTVYVAGLAIALLIVIFAVTAATLMVAQIVRG